MPRVDVESAVRKERALTRVMRLWPGVMLAVALGGMGVSAIQRPAEQAVPRAPMAPQALLWADGAGADATALQAVEPLDGTQSGPPPGVPTSTTFAGAQPAPKVMPAEAGASAATLPRDSATAGPPVSYTDPADDAYGPAGTGVLSQPAFDILQVRWAPASEVDPQARGYISSITVAGVARTDSGYVTYGDFPSDVTGERCQLYNVLTPGIAAFANVFCGATESGTRRFVGQLRGSEVTATRTAAGGTLLIATFDDSALPAVLEASGRMVFGLSAFACTGDPEGPAAGLGCSYVFDEANTFSSYRV